MFHLLLNCQVFHAELQESVATLQPGSARSPVAGDPNEKSWVLENKLEDINERYNRLLLSLSEKGGALNQSWQQLSDYDAKANQVAPWLEAYEERLGTKMARQISADPALVKRELADTKVRLCFDRFILFCFRTIG